MFIAHIPAGYITARFMEQKIASARNNSLFITVGCIGAIFPDVDMLYFYLFDHRQHHHHSYITHYPVIWFSLLLMSFIWYQRAKEKTYAVLGTIFTLNACFHLVFDTIVGDIWWFAPFIDKPYVMFTVRAQYQPWWLNFVFHWSFVVELVICFFAWKLYRQRYISGRKVNA